MKSFLESVAEDLLNRYGTNLSRVAVVFPNKRASLFLNEHLARLAGRPVWSPTYITISDLFRSHSHLKVADPILLVCELHKCFTQCTGINESLDHFYGWGQLLLADFDDLDKNMAPADKVFANLRDIHELDDVSYLSDEQRDMIRRFFSNFTPDHNSELKERFLRLWSHIGDIYNAFNRQLAAQNLCYEGALYRQVATDESLAFEYDTYAFIGFNLLQQVEQVLFRRLEQAGKAIFYQDTDEVPPQEVTFISAATENIQARYIPQWLTPERLAAGRRTAIVLCNEGLLQAVVHCLPERVEKVNITTGYPLLQTPVASLVTQLINLQVNGYSAKIGRFRRRWLDIVARHPFASLLPDDYASQHLTTNAALLSWLLNIIKTIATVPEPVEGPVTSSAVERSPLNSEACFKAYTLINRLYDLIQSGTLTIDTVTLQRLLQQLIQQTTIPFHGEPAEGLQVMGVLETRNLDFDHVLLLSCNEGYMPRGVNDTSFIPYAIRKAYGLTTVDHKVAIYQHYFHRLLQRAKDVTIVYNNATADGKTGEMSRFMLQLMIERPVKVAALRAGQTPQLRTPEAVDKTTDVIQSLQHRFSDEKGGLSPTAISTYLRCQLRFYYRYVRNLQEPDDNEEELIDNRIFGNIFHKACETLYKPFGQEPVTKMALDDLLKSGVEIERAVDAAIREELDLPLLDGLQIINREVIIRYVRQLLELDRRLTPFTILGLEKPVSHQLGDWKIGGLIDRLDMVPDPETGEDLIRVVDYKTGARRLKALPDVDAIFDPANIKDHSDYYLQAFLYSYIVASETQRAVSPALLFIQHAGADDYDPVLKLGKEPVRDIRTVAERYMQLLQQTIGEIFNAALTFSPTDDPLRCRTCPYAALCH